MSQQHLNVSQQITAALPSDYNPHPVCVRVVTAVLLIIPSVTSCCCWNQLIWSPFHLIHQHTPNHHPDGGDEEDAVRRMEEDETNTDEEQVSCSLLAEYGLKVLWS